MSFHLDELTQPQFNSDNLVNKSQNEVCSSNDTVVPFIFNAID